MLFQLPEESSFLLNVVDCSAGNIGPLKWLNKAVSTMHLSFQRLCSNPFFCFGLRGFTPAELHLEEKNQSKTIETMKFHMTSNKVIIHQFMLV